MYETYIASQIKLTREAYKSSADEAYWAFKANIFALQLI